MASSSTIQSTEGMADQRPNPVLERLANENTFDVEWPELQRQLHDAILDAVPIFQSMGLPRDRQSAPSPAERQSFLELNEIGSGTPEREGAPTSPTHGSGSGSGSTTKSEGSEKTPSPVPAKTLEPASSETQGSSPIIGPLQPSSDDDIPEELKPSTKGGLVIAPFPPLDPNRRKKANAAGSGSGPQVVSIAPRPNGMGNPTPPPIRITSGNVFDDEWDEDVVIGGKKLAGWMDEEEGKKEANRLVKILDEMDDPPFTIQRLAELLVRPTSQHKSLGKFLRAIEKILLVSTPWEAPSYTYVPGSTFPAPESSLNSMDSTMPPGMGTPQFSPIPFLRRPSPDAEGGEGSSNGLTAPGGHTEESMMSPLILGQGQNMAVAEDYRLDETTSARSPTPEPEETQPQAQETNSSTDIEMETGPAALTSSDPANQPYLGRVDELDTGPIQGNTDELRNKIGREDDRVSEGTGEGGGLTPHGMSERPVPISSTTVIADEERKIASLPSTPVVPGITEEKEK